MQPGMSGSRRQPLREMTGRFIKKHKRKFQGVRIMPPGWIDIVQDILEHAEIAPPLVGIGAAMPFAGAASSRDEVAARCRSRKK